MPVLGYSQRYKPNQSPYAPAGLLSPLQEDQDPAFNPSYQSQPPPEPIREADPIPNIATPPQRQAPQQEPAMPPPGMPPPVPDNDIPQPPQINVPPPQVPQALAPPSRMPAQDIARPAPPSKPPSAGDQQLTDANAAVKAAEATRPESPKSNWGQRIATAILAMTKFSPLTDEIVHPKWSDQERTYERNAGAAQRQLKNAETSLNAEGLAERRGADAAYKEAQTANIGLTSDLRESAQEDKKAAAEAKIAEMQSARNQNFMKNLTKDHDFQYQAVGEEVPNGWHFQEDPEKPGFGYAISPSAYKAPKDLLQFLPGITENELITPGELKDARKAKGAFDIAQAKLKDPPEPTAEYKNYLEAQKDPDFRKYQKENANLHVPTVNVNSQPIGGSEMNSRDRIVFNQIVDKAEKSPLIKGADLALGLQDTIQKAKADPSNAALQLNLQYQYVKALDTYQSAVREGELGLVQSIDSKAGQLVNSLQQIKNGQLVRPEVVNQIADAAANLVSTINASAQRKSAQFEAQAQQNGAAVFNAWKNYRNAAQASYDIPKSGNGSSAGGTVMMQPPNGGPAKPVPADQVEHFKSLGAKVVR